MQGWVSWEEEDRDIAVLHWVERDIHVVFPLRWAQARTMEQLVDHSRTRIADVERKCGDKLAPSSVLRAFPHVLREEITADIIKMQIDPEVPYWLGPRLKD